MRNRHEPSTDKGDEPSTDADTDTRMGLRLSVYPCSWRRTVLTEAGNDTTARRGAPEPIRVSVSYPWTAPTPSVDGMNPVQP